MQDAKGAAAVPPVPPAPEGPPDATHTCLDVSCVTIYWYS